MALLKPLKIPLGFPGTYSPTEGGVGGRLPCQLFHRFKALLQVVDDVVDMLGTDGKANRVGFDAGSKEFPFTHLGVRSGSRMNHQGFNIRHIRKEREQAQFLSKDFRFFRAAFQFKGEDGCPAPGEVPAVEVVIPVVGEQWMVHPFNLRVVL